MSNHTPGPWSLCRNGDCKCNIVSCNDHPIANVSSGDWGDEFPSIRLIGSTSLDLKAEPFMDKISYGNIPEEVASANARLIAAAPEMYEALRAIVGNWSERMGGDIEELKEGIHPEMGKYWSPSASLVSSEFIAAARLVIANINNQK